MAMAKVRTECNKVAGMSVFQVPVAKSMKLEEFEQTQGQVSTQVGKWEGEEGVGWWWGGGGGGCWGKGRIGGREGMGSWRSTSRHRGKSVHR